MRRHVPLLFLLVTLVGCGQRAGHEGKSIEQLEGMVRDADPVLQVQGAHGLGLKGPEAHAAVPALADLLKREHLQARQQAALALGKIGPGAQAAVPALIEALRDSEWTVRRNAVNALGLIGGEARKATPQVQNLASDPDHLVRKAAQEALKKLRD